MATAEAPQSDGERRAGEDSESPEYNHLHPDSQQQQRTFDVGSRQAYKSEDYRQLFHLPPEEVLVQDFNCALQKKILLQGHMYLFERYLCFYSNIFGYEKKKVIPLKDVTFVRKAKTAGFFPNAIEITAWGKQHFFASFLSRDEAYRLLIEGWSHHSGYAKPFLKSHISSCSTPDVDMLEHNASLSEKFLCPSTVGSSEWICDRKFEEECSIITNERSEDDIIASDKYLEGTSCTKCIPITPQSSLWQVEDGNAPPLLENFKTIVECEFPIDEEDFFNLFFSNDAIKFVEIFHRKCGDEDFNCSQWIKHHHFGHVRDISFRHPINLYFGPKASYCHEVQRFKLYSNRHVIIETSQQMSDVPYGDYFHVEARWDVKRLLARPTPCCLICISLDVAFSKKTVWKSKIVQGTFGESKQAYSTWIREALALLNEIGVLQGQDQKLKSDLANLEKAEIQALPTTITRTTDVVSASTGTVPIQKPASYDENVYQFQKPRHSEPLLFESGERASKVSRAPTPETSCVRKPVGPIDLRSTKDSQDEQKVASRSKSSESATQKFLSSCANINTGTDNLLRVLVVVFAAIILLLQIGIMVILAKAPVLTSPHIDNNGRLLQSNGHSCFAGSSGQAELKWLEQRSHSLKEEIAVAENRLQNLQHDFMSIKLHFHQFEEMYPHVNINKQNLSLNLNS